MNYSYWATEEEWAELGETYPIVAHRWTGDGKTAEFNFDLKTMPVNEKEMVLKVNDLRRHLGTDFELIDFNRRLRFTYIPAYGDRITVVYTTDFRAKSDNAPANS